MRNDPHHPAIDREAPTDPGLDPVTAAPAESPNGRASLVVVRSTSLRELCQLYPLDAGAARLTLGRADDNAVVVDSQRASRRHAALERRDGAWWIVDLGSANGTRVNGARVTERPLVGGDHVALGGTVLKFLAGHDIEGQYFAAIRGAMVTDGLTLAQTHAAFRERLDAEFRRARRYRRPLSLVLLDLDHFKSVNDTHGHLMGDEVLRAVTAVVRGRVRAEEAVGRLGGEEFGILLPETTLHGARVVAADLQQRIADAPVSRDAPSLRVTASFGVATLTPDCANPEALLARADQLLYAAKTSGRNRLVCDGDALTAASAAAGASGPGGCPDPSGAA